MALASTGFKVSPTVDVPILITSEGDIFVKSFTLLMSVIFLGGLLSTLNGVVFSTAFLDTPPTIAPVMKSAVCCVGSLGLLTMVGIPNADAPRKMRGTIGRILIALNPPI